MSRTTSRRGKLLGSCPQRRFNGTSAHSRLGASPSSSGGRPMGQAFTLDPRIEGSSVPVADWPLAQIRLKDDSRFHWLLLVPRRTGVVELTDLDEADYGQLTAEILA